MQVVDKRGSFCFDTNRIVPDSEAENIDISRKWALLCRIHSEYKLPTYIERHLPFYIKGQMPFEGKYCPQTLNWSQVKKHANNLDFWNYGPISYFDVVEQPINSQKKMFSRKHFCLNLAVKIFVFLQECNARLQTLQ